jgi:beta-lactamase regulating signal transducer with metallopeptidase domain
MTALLVRAVLTYLVHSTLLLGAAVLLRMALGDRRLAVQEACLRAALVGGFVSASLQVGLAVRPIAGEWRLPLAILESSAPPSVAAPPARPQEGRPETIPTASADSEVMARAGAAPGFGGDSAEMPSVARRARTPNGSGGAVSILAIWGVLALVSLARLGFGAMRLRRILRDRRTLLADDLPAGTGSVAAALGLAARVRWSEAPRLPVPIAFGLVRPEVCLPTRAVADLGRNERLAVCAHELAHLARRDPAWILMARLIEAIAPFQPLNVWARRRLLVLAECLSDDLAVGASGARLGLARSLVDVASWTVPGRPLLTAAAGAVGARSRLGHRVERLMNADRPLERPCRSLLVAAAVVVAAAAVSPTVSGGGRPSAVADPAVAAQSADAAAPAVSAEPATPSESAKPAPEDGKAETQRSAAERDRAAAERRLEALGRQIQDRARSHEAEMRKLQAEIDALGGRIRATTPEMDAVNRALEAEIAASVGALADADAASTLSRADAAKLAERFRREVDGPALAALGEKARALAAIAAPTPEEAREMAKLAAEIAHSARADAADIDRAVREAARAAAGPGSALEQARRARDIAREAEAAARDALRRVEDEIRRLEAEQRDHPQPR